MKNKNIEKLLRTLFDKKKKDNINFPVENDVDYYLISKYIEGKTSADENKIIAQLKEKDPTIAELLSETPGDLQSEDKKGSSSIIGRIISFSPHVSRIFRYAACVVFLLGSTFVLTIILRPQNEIGNQKPTSSPIRRSLVPLRGGKSESATNKNEKIKKQKGVKLSVLEIDNGSGKRRNLKLYDTSRALLIGIDDYDHHTKFPRLKSAVRDTLKVRAKLKEFQFDDVVTLLNNDATKQNILEKLEKMISATSPEGALFIYFAGHGERLKTTEGDKGYFVPYNGTRNPKKFDEKNVTLSAIKKLILKKGPKHTYIALDCCYSGLICLRSGSPFVPSAPDFFYLKMVTSKPVVQVLAASGKQGESIDGLFAQEFISALGQVQSRSFITAKEINKYVTEKVQKRAYEEYRFKQVPNHTALLRGGGEYIFARACQPEAPLPTPKLSLITTYRLPIENHYYLEMADVDDDGSLDFIDFGSNYIKIINKNGEIKNERTFEHYIKREDKNIKNVNYDSYLEILVSANIGTNLCFIILDKDLNTIKEFYTPVGSVVLSTEPLRTIITDSEVEDINCDYRRELVTTLATGFDLTPRGVSVFDYDTTELNWHYETGPNAMEFSLDTDVNSGEKLILVGTYSVANGYKEPRGSDDEHSYIWLLNSDGTERWRKEIGEYFTRVTPKFVDLDNDGRNEILASMLSRYEFKKNKDSKYNDDGNIYLFNLSGELLCQFTNNLSIMSLAVLPNYVENQFDVLIATRSGNLILLGSNLQIKKQHKFPNKSNYVSMAKIKGFMDTFFGQFVVVLHYEEDRCKLNVKESLGNITKTYNNYIALLDKKTLKEQYRISLPDTEFETIGNPTEVKVEDIDADGQDELLILHEDRIEVYKLK